MLAVLSKPVVPSGEWPSSKRRKGINALSDIEVWDLPDEQIIAAAFETWRSLAYSHYIVHILRRYDETKSPPAPVEILFVFICKFHDESHSPLYRSRTKTGSGTTFLLEKKNQCETRRGMQALKLEDELPKLDEMSVYSEAKHRAILALWCAQSHRPFECVNDPCRRMEVELLRPGTSLPSSTTVSRDVKTIYAQTAPAIRDYFQAYQGALHLVIDGWTSPVSESYLGVIIVWEQGAVAHRCILEFIQLTASHTGEYLAERTVECLRRFGIEKKILASCLDNARNNLTMIKHLEKHIPSFLGTRSYVRCFAHIINLMARAFMSPFSTPSRSTKRVTDVQKAVTPNPPPTQTIPVEPQAVVVPGIDGLEQPEATEIDEGKLEHDTAVVQQANSAAAQEIQQVHGISVSSSALKAAQGVMTKVSGLARKVHQSTSLTVKFHGLVAKDPDLSTKECDSLEQRVVTRWNSDRKCLGSHLYFRHPVQWLTSDSSLDLESYALDSEQWSLAYELNDVLEIFEEPTNHFSKSEVALVHEVLPAFLTMKHRLEHVRDSPDPNPVIRIGAQAALNVFDKYLGAMQECDIYFIAIVMCPNHKLEWFWNQGYDSNEVQRIKNLVVERFYASYPVETATKPTSQHDNTKPINRWMQQPIVNFAALTHNPDSIERYLATETVPLDPDSDGSLLSYWNVMLKTQPRLARMALNYLTAPATSVDAERAFSGGRLMINHLQHGMSSDTFQAKMAIGSWFGTPLLPNALEVSHMIEKTM